MAAAYAAGALALCGPCHVVVPVWMQMMGSGIATLFLDLPVQPAAFQAPGQQLVGR